MNALFVDTSTRDLSVYSVSITKIQDGGLVLRSGSKLGMLHQVDELNTEDTPILISLKGYEAQSSGGYVNLINPPTKTQQVVGMCGFPKMGSGSLRPVEPFKVSFIGGLRKLKTHNNLNQGTAFAAYQGLRKWANATNKLYLAEGQSNETAAWEILSLKEDISYEFPKEHRTDIFSPKNILDSYNKHWGWENDVVLAKIAKKVEERDFVSFVSTDVQRYTDVPEDEWENYVDLVHASNEEITYGISVHSKELYAYPGVDIKVGEKSFCLAKLSDNGFFSFFLIVEMLVSNSEHSQEEKTGIIENFRKEWGLTKALLKESFKNSEWYELFRWGLVSQQEELPQITRGILKDIEDEFWED